MKKVLDQTVRELKREVNKVLNVPEIEQKVLDVTSNEPWGPHGSIMADIAHATRNYNDYQIIMSILWRRMSDTGKNWRHVYKALTVFEYLVAHGSERVIDELREHVYQLNILVDFQYFDSRGRDQGLNVRKKSQSLIALVKDKERIREVRHKAMENRDKYRGPSSTGGLYKPSSYHGSRGSSYGDDRYDDDRYGRDSPYGDHRDRDYGGNRYRDDDRDRSSGYGGDRYRDDDRSGGYGGDRYSSRDNDRGYGGDRYRDNERSSYGREEYRSSDYGHDEEDQDSRRNYRSRSYKGSPRDEDPQQAAAEDETTRRKSSPPSYEDAVNGGSGGSNSTVPPQQHHHAATVPATTTQDQTRGAPENTTTSQPSAKLHDISADEADEFDPRAFPGSAAAPSTLPASYNDLSFLGQPSSAAEDSSSSLATVLALPAPPLPDASNATPFNSTNPQPLFTTVPLSSSYNGGGPDVFGQSIPFKASAAAAESGAAAEGDMNGFFAGGAAHNAFPVAASTHAHVHAAVVSPPQVIIQSPAIPSPTLYNVTPSFIATAAPPPPSANYSQQPPPPFIPAHNNYVHYPPAPVPAVAAPAAANFQPLATPAASVFNAQAAAASSNSANASSSSANYVNKPQQEKKFETKSSVWADTLNKGLIDLNIAGPKSNPLAGIGVDFDQLRKSERLKEERSSSGGGSKSSSGASGLGMGKAMGSGSGLGLAGASAIAPPTAPPPSMNRMGMLQGMMPPMAMPTPSPPMMRMANSGMPPMGMMMGSPAYGMGGPPPLQQQQQYYGAYRSY